MGKYGITVQPAQGADAEPKRGKYGVVVAPAIHGPGTGDVAAPDVAPVDDSAHPPTTEENAPGSIASFVLHGARGVAGRVPDMISSGISAAISPEGGSFGERYDRAMQDSELRAQRAAEEHPVASATGATVGTVAPFVAGGSFISSGSGLQQLGKLAGIAGMQGALKGGPTGAVEGLGWGMAGGMAGALPAATAPLVRAGVQAAPLAFGTYEQGKALTDPNASSMDRIAAAEGLLLPVAERGTAAGAAKLRGEADTTRGLRMMAERDARATSQARLDEGGQAVAAAEQTAVNDVERQRAQTRQQNIARTDAALAAEKADAAAATDAARQAAQDSKAGRGLAFNDEQQRFRATKEAQDASRQAANDSVQLADIAHKREMLNALDAYDKALADAKQRQAAAKSKSEAVRAQLDTAAEVTAAKKKLLDAYEKETARLKAEALGEGMTEEEAAKAAEGRYAQLHGTLGSRMRDIYEMADQGHIDQVNPAHAPRAKLAAESLNNLETDETRFADRMNELIAEHGSKEAAHEAWVKEEAARRLAKANAGDPEAAAALKDRPDRPADLDAQAQAAAAEKARARRTLDKETRSAADQILRDAGIDPATVTDEQIINRDIPTENVPLPTRPDDRDYQRQSLDVREQKILGRSPPLQKPDALAKQRADMLDSIGALLAARAAKAKIGTGPSRTDPGLILEEREALKPSTADGTPLDVATEDAIRQGREDVRGGLRAARIDRDLLGQYLRELKSGAVAEAARSGALSAPGSAVGGTPGSVAGSVLSKLFSRPKESFLSSRYLGRSDSMAGVAPGDVPVERYSKPGAAAAIFREVEPALRQQADAKSQKATTLSRAALAAAMSDPGFVSWLNEKQKERDRKKERGQ